METLLLFLVGNFSIHIDAVIITCFLVLHCLSIFEIPSDETTKSI